MLRPVSPSHSSLRTATYRPPQNLITSRHSYVVSETTDLSNLGTKQFPFTILGLRVSAGIHHRELSSAKRGGSRRNPRKTIIRVFSSARVLPPMKNFKNVGRSSRETVDLLLAAIADTIADRLEHRQQTRRRLLSVEEAAEYLGRSESAVYNLVSDGKLRSVRFDRRISFDIRDLDNLIEQAKQAG
jgi:excisionase family DNA binding protein